MALANLLLIEGMNEFVKKLETIELFPLLRLKI